MYLDLIEGKDAPEPFSTRFMLIFLGQILPGSAVENILTVNIICLYILTLSLFRLARKYTSSPISAALSVVFIFGSFSFSYNFTNPYLTDLPGLAFLTLFIISVQNRNFYNAIIFMAISLFFRETGIVLLPLFLMAFRKKLAITGIFISILAYVGPKIYIAGGIYSPVMQTNLGLTYVVKVILSLGWIWAIAGLSLFLNRNKLTKFEITLLLFSFIGSFYSSLTAADTTRMFLLMIPVCTVLIAFLLKDPTKNLWFWTIICLLFLANTMLMLPTTIFDGSGYSSIESFVISNVKVIAVVNTLIFITLITNRRYLLKILNE